MTTVLALDLASVSGWAVGEPGEEPVWGTIRFARPGASHEAIFANALKWTFDKIALFKPGIVVWEAPMPTSFGRGKSNLNTTTLLYGLPAIVGAAAYTFGVYDIRKASTRDVRNHFIGSNPKRAKAKPLVMDQCRKMGWLVVNDNEADALATLSYMCAILNPRLALKVTPLFGRTA